MSSSRDFVVCSQKKDRLKQWELVKGDKGLKVVEKKSPVVSSDDKCGPRSLQEKIQEPVNLGMLLEDRAMDPLKRLEMQVRTIELETVDRDKSARYDEHENLPKTVDDEPEGYRGVGGRVGLPWVEEDKGEDVG